MITLFTNFKGGVANTTSATAYAHFLSRLGHKTALLDFDFQADATKAYGYSPSADASNFVEGDECTFYNPRKNLYLLPCDGSLKGIETGISARPQADQQKAMARIVNRIRKGCADFDHVVIDTGKRGAMQEISVLAADRIILPVTLDFNAASNTASAVECFQQWNPDAKIVILPVGLDNRQGAYNLEVINMITESAGTAKVYTGGIVQSQTMKRTGFMNKTVFESAEFKAVADSYFVFFNWLGVK